MMYGLVYASAAFQAFINNVVMIAYIDDILNLLPNPAPPPCKKCAGQTHLFVKGGKCGFHMPRHVPGHHHGQRQGPGSGRVALSRLSRTYKGS